MSIYLCKKNICQAKVYDWIDKDNQKEENSTRIYHSMANITGKAGNANEPGWLLFLAA